MSIFSDYKCGALSESDYRYECNKMNRQARHEEEEYWDALNNPDPEEEEEDEQEEEEDDN